MQLITAMSERSRVLHRSTTADSARTAPMSVQTSFQFRDWRLTTSSWPSPPTPTTPSSRVERTAHSNR